MIIALIELPPIKIAGRITTVFPIARNREAIDEFIPVGREFDTDGLNAVNRYKVIDAVAGNIEERIFYTEEPIDPKSAWWRKTDRIIYPIYTRTHHRTIFKRQTKESDGKPSSWATAVKDRSVDVIRYKEGISQVLDIWALSGCCGLKTLSDITEEHMSKQVYATLKKTPLQRYLDSNRVVGLDEDHVRFNLDIRYLSEMCDGSKESIDNLVRLYTEYRGINVYDDTTTGYIYMNTPMLKDLAPFISPDYGMDFLEGPTFKPAFKVDDNDKFTDLSELEETARPMFHSMVEAIMTCPYTDIDVTMKSDGRKGSITRNYEVKDRIFDQDMKKLEFDKFLDIIERWFMKKVKPGDKAEMHLVRTWLDQITIEIKKDGIVTCRYLVDLASYNLACRSLDYTLQ